MAPAKDAMRVVPSSPRFFSALPTAQSTTGSTETPDSTLPRTSGPSHPAVSTQPRSQPQPTTPFSRLHSRPTTSRFLIRKGSRPSLLWGTDSDPGGARSGGQWVGDDVVAGGFEVLDLAAD